MFQLSIPAPLSAAVLAASMASAQTMSTVAGQPVPLANGSALNQFIEAPFGRLATDAAGNVYVGATVANQIVKINPSTGVLTVVAGTGTPGFAGDGGPAVSALISYPYAIALDTAGNLYFADGRNARIRRISTAGIITTVAGTGSSGFSGDGGQATSGQLRSFVPGVAVDAAGNLYIADNGNSRIRKVNTSGVITTIAGTGTAGYSGDGGAATAAQINNPHTVAVDSTGRVCFADENNQRVRCISSSGIITTVAGTGTAGFNGDNIQATAAQLNGPFAVTFDAQANLFIAERSNHRIRKITAATGVITTVAGTGTSGFTGDGGPATSARLFAPTGVSVDSLGNLYLIDENFRLRQVNPSGVISTVGGMGRFGGDGGPAFNALLDNPNGLAIDSAGNLFVTDTLNNRVRKIDSAGNITTYAGTGTASSTGDGGQATAATLNRPFGLAFDSSSNLYIADSNGHRIRRVTPGGVISTIAGTGTAGISGDGGAATSAQLTAPALLVFDTAGNLYISESAKIRKITPGGTISTVAGTGTVGFSGDGGPATAAQVNLPRGMAFDPQGNLYFADRSNHRIRKIDTSGIISTFAGTGTAATLGDGGPAVSAAFNLPTGLSADSAGNLWIGESGGSRIRFIEKSSGIVAAAAGTGSNDFLGDGGPALNAAIRGPVDLLVTAAGTLIFADTGNDRVRRFTVGTPVVTRFIANPTGRIITVDNINFVTPFAKLWSQGSTHTISVPTQTSASGDRYAFSSWADGAATNSRTITASASTTYSANLVRQFQITGTVSPTGGGTVTSGFFTEGSQVTVQATPASGYQFASFSGDLTGATNPQVITMNANKSVTANFTLSGGGGGTGGRRFVPMTPCRLVDTREAGLGALGAPIMAASSTRSFVLPSSACGVPANAGAYSLNVTVVPQGPLGFLTIWPTGQSQPFVSTLNSADGRIKANAAIVPAGTGGAVSVFVTNATHVVIDINGYFIDPALNAQALAFYPLTPCRVFDSRNATGSLGGPILTSTREIPVRSSACGVPATAQAYSLNATVVPPGALAYLTLWPTGQSQPFVSTLNAFTGSIVANAAIVPAGANGSINAFVSSQSHLVLDINGYFAPPGAANAQSFYAVTPCRLVDTRNATGEFGGPVLAGGGTRSYRLPLASCGLPANATAFSLNATVVPTTALAYLTLFPSGAAQPFVSTLNAFDDAIVANAAIVPAGASGGVSSFVTDQTHLILDTNGYFAP